jgi:creatinine amidohydrolase/Fe(II)-dependent formamide hydrolase-like protein
MPTGALGDTSLATAEKGRVLFDRMTEELSGFALSEDFYG